MNKDDLSRRVAEKYSVSIKDSKLWLDAFIDVLAESVTEDTVKLRNFGNFELHKMSARKARDLNTNSEIVLPERMKLFFVPCPKLAEKIKSMSIIDVEYDSTFE